MPGTSNVELYAAIRRDASRTAWRAIKPVARRSRTGSGHRYVTRDPRSGEAAQGRVLASMSLRDHHVVKRIVLF